MFYTDSHIHLQDFAFSEAKEVVNSALRNNVREFVVPSAKPDDWKSIVKITKRFDNVVGAIGVHPWCVENADVSLIQTMEKFLKKNSSLWIGECGIDTIHNPETEKQCEFFEAQIELAQKYNRALIIHAVKADNILSSYFQKLPEQTIFHSFTGSLEWGKKIQKAGFYLGINFSFFKKKNAPEMITNLDLSKILLETDAPYQPRKGYIQNVPENLPVLASAMAAILNMSETEICAVLSKNWKTFLTLNLKE